MILIHLNLNISAPARKMIFMHLDMHYFVFAAIYFVCIHYHQQNWLFT